MHESRRDERRGVQDNNGGDTESSEEESSEEESSEEESSEEESSDFQRGHLDVELGAAEASKTGNPLSSNDV
jgi:hypothetical protein